MRIEYEIYKDNKKATAISYNLAYLNFICVPFLWLALFLAVVMCVKTVSLFNDTLKDYKEYIMCAVTLFALAILLSLAFVLALTLNNKKEKALIKGNANLNPTEKLAACERLDNETKESRKEFIKKYWLFFITGFLTAFLAIGVIVTLYRVRLGTGNIITLILCALGCVVVIVAGRLIYERINGFKRNFYLHAKKINNCSLKEEAEVKKAEEDNCYCISCGNKLPNDSEFCPFCGRKL